MNLDEDDDTSNDLCSRNSYSKPIRNAAIAARNKLKVWLDYDDDVLLRSI